MCLPGTAKPRGAGWALGTQRGWMGACRWSGAEQDALSDVSGATDAARQILCCIAFKCFTLRPVSIVVITSRQDQSNSHYRSNGEGSI